MVGQLRRFLHNGQIELSNNLAEKAIRPVAIGHSYEQVGIRQSLTPAERDCRRWTLDMVDGTALPTFA